MAVCIRFVHGLWKALHDVRFSVLGMHALAKPRHECEYAKREGAHHFHGVIPCTRGCPHVPITFMEPFRECEDARMSGYVALRNLRDHTTNIFTAFTTPAKPSAAMAAVSAIRLFLVFLTVRPKKTFL